MQRWRANVRTFRRSEAQGVFWGFLFFPSSFFLSSPRTKTSSVESGFSAGKQRRHVWRRSRCCPAWKLHSCRSGLFSLGQSHKSVFRLDRRKKKTDRGQTDSLSVSCVKYMTVNRKLSGKLHTANCSLQLCHVWDRHSDINKYSGVRLC